MPPKAPVQKVRPTPRDKSSKANKAKTPPPTSPSDPGDAGLRTHRSRSNIGQGKRRGSDGSDVTAQLTRRTTSRLSKQEERDINAFIDSILAEDEEEWMVTRPTPRPRTPDRDARALATPGPAAAALLSARSRGGADGRTLSPRHTSRGPGYSPPGVTLHRVTSGVQRVHSGLQLRGGYSGALDGSPQVGGHGDRRGCDSGSSQSPTSSRENTFAGSVSSFDIARMDTARIAVDGRMKVLCAVEGDERLRALLLRRRPLQFAEFRSQIEGRLAVSLQTLYYIDSDGDKIEIDDDDSLDAILQQGDAKMKIFGVPHGAARGGGAQRSPPQHGGPAPPVAHPVSGLPAVPIPPVALPVGSPQSPATGRFAGGALPAAAAAAADGAEGDGCRGVVRKAASERLGITWADHTLLASIVQNSPAERCGMHRFIGRRAIAINGHAIERLRDIRAAVDGQTVVTIAFSEHPGGASPPPLEAAAGAAGAAGLPQPAAQLPPTAESGGWVSERVALSGHEGPVYACALSSDAVFAVTGARDKTLRLWLTATGQQVQVLCGHTDFVLCCDVSRDGRWVISGSGDRTSLLWGRGEQGGGFSLYHTLTEHSDRVYDAKVGPDSSTAVTASCDRTLRVWHCSTGACLHVLRGHADAVLCVAFGQSPGSRLLASGGDDTKLMLWDWHVGLADGGMAPGHQKTVWSCVFSNDDRLLCSAALAPEVLVWEVRTRQVIRRLLGHQNAAVHRVCFTGPRRLLSCGRDHSIVLWDLDAATDARALVARMTGHTNVVYCVCSQRGVVATSSADATAKIWHCPAPR